MNIDLANYKIVGFTVVSDSDKDKFEREVNYLIEESHIPCGMMILDKDGVYHIPMVKVIRKPDHRRGFGVD